MTPRQLLSGLIIAVLATTPLASYVAGQDGSQDFDVQVTKSVDNPTPGTPLQTVEFSILVSNVGESAADGIVVEDKLPPGLTIPEGMVANTSSGVFDAATGLWTVGEIEPGDSHLLNIPVIVDVSPQPACIVNRAALVGSDADNSDNADAVAIRLPGIERCVDLYAGWIRPPFGDDFCGGSQSVDYEFIVQNRGPHDARGVTLTVSEISDFKLPGLRIDSPGCSGLVCRWETIPAKRFHTVFARSSRFNNQVFNQHRVRLAVTTIDEDYNQKDNIYILERDFPTFSTPCPDYGIPEPSLPIAGDGGGGSGCFIATASYGSRMHTHVQALRAFRDRWLLTNRPGRALVEVYYRYSPAAADSIAKSPERRVAARIMLWPLVMLATFPVRFLAIALLLVSLFAALKWRRKRSG